MFNAKPGEREHMLAETGYRGRMKFTAVIVVCMLCAGLLWAMPAAAEETGSGSLRLNKTSLTLVNGLTCKLKASGAGLTGKVTWQSSNRQVVRVNSRGRIRGKSAGNAVITATAGAYKAVCRVQVVDASLNKTSLPLTQGKRAKLKVRGSSVKTTWKSSDPQVATVSSSGKVTAKNPGTATVYAKIGVSKLSCTVTVVSARWDKLKAQYLNDSKTGQLVFVQYTGGSDARVQMYRKSGGTWDCIVDCPAYVGQNGIGKEREGDKKTPTGVYTLTQAFGIEKDPGAKMPYVKVNKYLYWCADDNYYNQMVDVRDHPHTCRGEHLINYAPNYNYAMALDYNKDCVVGKGSAIFLHCMGPNAYTAGCIAVSQENMIKILQNAELSLP